MASSNVSRALRPLWRRVLSAVGRGFVSLATDDQELEQLQLKLFAGEVRGDLEVLGHYGLASAVEPGAEAVVVFLGGNRDAGVIVSADDRRYRPRDLAPGEVRVYSRFGSSVRLLADGSVEIKPANGTVRIDGDAIVSGDVKSGGDVSAAGDVRDGSAGLTPTLELMRETFNLHTHVEHGPPGPTSPPVPQM